jgi:hypothetical protein
MRSWRSLSVRVVNARRLVLLTFLSLFRMLRYVSLAEASINEPPELSKRALATVYVVFSVLRSDGRALAGYLRRRLGGPVLADAFDTD